MWEALAGLSHHSIVLPHAASSWFNIESCADASLRHLIGLNFHVRTYPLSVIPDISFNLSRIYGCRRSINASDALLPILSPI